MKPLKKMISITQLSKNVRGANLLQILAMFLFSGVFALPMAANAQSSTCAANEVVQSYTFANPNNWPAGSATIGYTIGTGASSVTVSGTATLANSSVNFPTTGPSGGFADSYNYQVDRTTTTATNVVTITFSKPISKLQLVATDLDYGVVNGVGAYQDRVTILGNGPSGVVTPTAVATDPTRVGIVGNVATSLSTSNGGNCPSAFGAAGANLCNATFSFPQPITSFTYTYGNGPSAFGNPPEQLVGLAALGFCVQNPDLALVKDDGGATFVAGSTGTYTFTVNNVGSAATTGTTTVKDILPLGMSFGTPLTPGGTNAAAWSCAVSTTTNANDTATCTSTTAIAAAGASTFTLPVNVAAGTTGTLTNRAKVYGGGDPNKAAETTTGTIASCASDSVAGGVAGAGCGFETTPVKTITLTLQKAWSGATIGDAVTVSATGLTSLFAVANTATEIDAGIVQNVLLGSKTLTETFTTGNSANYTSTLACTGNSNALVGNVLTVAIADTAIVCTFTNTRNVANLVVTKNDSKTTTVSGDTNTYSITVTNNGPLAANNTLITDPAVAGLTCSTVICTFAGGASCPATSTVAALQSSGLIIPTLPNTGSVTLTLTCSVSATGV